MQKKLSKLQTYNVMLHFLEIFWLRNKSDDIGDILSDSEFFWDGRTTADPGSWFTWKQALALTMQQDQTLRKENRLNLFQAFHAMLNYIKVYRSRWGVTEDIDDLIQELQILYENYDTHNPMWQSWFKLADEVAAMRDPRVQKQLSK